MELIVAVVFSHHQNDVLNFRNIGNGQRIQPVMPSRVNSGHHTTQLFKRCSVMSNCEDIMKNNDAE